MNLLSVLAPTTVPVDQIEGIQGRVAFRAVVKAIKVQHEMAEEVLRLLDPNVGTRFNRSA